MRIDTLFDTFSPGITLARLLAFQKTHIERRTIVGVIDHPLLHMFQANPLNPGRGTLQISRFFPIKLDEGTAIFLHLLARLDLAQ